MFRWLSRRRQERAQVIAVNAALAGFNFCMLRWIEAHMRWHGAGAADTETQQSAISEQGKWFSAAQWWHDELRKTIGINDGAAVGKE